MSLAGIQPSLSQDLVTKLGPQLLGYVRSLEAPPSSSNSNSIPATAIDSAITSLHTLVGVASRQGIFQNDIKMAESFIMASSPTTSLKEQFKKCRSDDDHDGAAALSSTLPIQLVMMAILRIFGLKNSVSCDPDIALLVTLAADLVLAISQHGRQNQGTRAGCPMICVEAELEWLQGSAKSLLSALYQVISELVAGLRQNKFQVDAVEFREALVSCLQASSDLVVLAGTRLSRSQTLVSNLETTLWDAASCEGIPIRPVATLLASLPLTGGTDRSTPAMQWTKSVQNTQAFLWNLLKKSVPISQRIKAVHEFPLPSAVEERLEKWWVTLQCLEKQESRAASTIKMVKSLVSILIELFRQGRSNLAFFGSSIIIPSFLDLIDGLLSVPMSAEAAYYGTKKRLRNEPLDSCLMSPASIAKLLANHLFIEGQELLTSFITFCGGPTLLPHATRLRQVGYAAVLTSCSPTLRHVLEPGYNVSKKRRWLSHSLVARTSAIRTLETLVTTLGVQSTPPLSKSRRRSSAKDMDQIVKVVGGCLLEQLYPHQEENIDWGSSAEKTDLVVASVNCLSSFLSCGGEFLTLEARQLVDSVASTCFSFLLKPPVGHHLQSSLISQCILEFGKACVFASWPDGSASSLRNAINQTVLSFSDACGGSLLSCQANSARQLCDSMSNPSVPALFVITRQQEDPPLADELMAKMEQVRADSKILVERRKEGEEKRKKAKLEKRYTNADSLTRKDKVKNDMSTSAPRPGQGDMLSENLSQQKEKIVTATEKTQTEKEKRVTNEAATKITPPVKNAAATPNVPKNPPLKPEVESKDETDFDDDFPMIVDDEPDEEDIDDE